MTIQNSATITHFPSTYNSFEYEDGSVALEALKGSTGESFLLVLLYNIYIVSLVRDLQYLRRNFSGTFLEKATGGFCRI